MSKITISRESLNDVLISGKAILAGRNEFGGTFTDVRRICRGQSCANTSFGVKTSEGSGCSSPIPDADINFHTHPVACYKKTRSIWGWPSGTDMGAVLDLKNICHIIFALEGAYIIKVNKNIVNNKPNGLNEYIIELFSRTHKYRIVDNYESHASNFKSEFNVKCPSNNPLDVWLKLANNLTVNIGGRPLKVFTVKLIKNNSFQYNKSHPNHTWGIIQNIDKRNLSQLVHIPRDISV